MHTGSNLWWLLGCWLTAGAAAFAASVDPKVEVPTTFAYKFTPGQKLAYRVNFRTGGTVTQPEIAQPMTLESSSMLELTAGQPTPPGWSITIATANVRASMNGRPPPALSPPPAQSVTVIVQATGAVRSGNTALEAGPRFFVLFPARPLKTGETFVVDQAPSNPRQPPIRMTYTLTNAAATLPGYPGRVAQFDGKAALGQLPGRTMALLRGQSTIFFDAAAGVLVKSTLGYTIDEVLGHSEKDRSGKSTLQVDYEAELLPKGR